MLFSFPPFSYYRVILLIFATHKPIGPPEKIPVCGASAEDMGDAGQTGGTCRICPAAIPVYDIHAGELPGRTLDGVILLIA